MGEYKTIKFTCNFYGYYSEVLEALVNVPQHLTFSNSTSGAHPASSLAYFHLTGAHNLAIGLNSSNYVNCGTVQLYTLRSLYYSFWIIYYNIRISNTPVYRNVEVIFCRFGYSTHPFPPTGCPILWVGFSVKSLGDYFNRFGTLILSFKFTYTLVFKCYDFYFPHF